MPDPLDVLREGWPPLAPRPAFARELRARLHAALGRTDLTGDPMSTTATTTAVATTATAAAAPSALVPYITVGDAVAAIAWYRDVFGAVEVGDRYTEDGGRIGHAEVSIGGAVMMLSEAYPELGFNAPPALGGTPVSLHLTVPDVDDTVARARRAGARIEREPADQPYGARSSSFHDPFGHRWTVQTPLSEARRAEVGSEMPGYTVAPASRQGELFYVTMRVRDGARAARFFGELLGWRTEPTHAGGFHVGSTNQAMGLHGADEVGVDLFFVVDDLAAAIAQVRRLGGTAEEPATYESGGAVRCHDDQGTEFWLSEPAPGY